MLTSSAAGTRENKISVGQNQEEDLLPTAMSLQGSLQTKLSHYTNCKGEFITAEQILKGELPAEGNKLNWHSRNVINPIFYSLLFVCAFIPVVV